MKIIINSENTLNIESSIVSLRDLRAVINGTVLDARAEIAQNEATRIELRFSTSALGTFGVSIEIENEARAWIKYWEKNLDRKSTRLNSSHT